MRFMTVDSHDTAARTVADDGLLAVAPEYRAVRGTVGVPPGTPGFLPNTNGGYVRRSGKRHTAIDGPFVETKELIAG